MNNDNTNNDNDNNNDRSPRCLLPIMVRERGSPTLFVAYFTEGG